MSDSEQFGQALIKHGVLPPRTKAFTISAEIGSLVEITATYYVEKEKIDAAAEEAAKALSAPSERCAVTKVNENLYLNFSRVLVASMRNGELMLEFDRVKNSQMALRGDEARQAWEAFRLWAEERVR